VAGGDTGVSASVYTGSSTLTRILNALAGTSYRVRRSALARWLFIGLAIASLGVTLFARPSQLENQTIRETSIGNISLASETTYVRVSGVLDTTGAYRTQYKLGGIELFGSRYVPLVEQNSFDAIYVIDENLPTRDPSLPVTIVGQVLRGEGTAQPEVYLQIGYPPNVVLANLLARVGMISLATLFALALLAWTIERMDYAIPLPWSGNMDVPHFATATAQRGVATQEGAPPLLWFGELGRQYNDTVLRSQPAEFNATPHEARFDSIAPKGQWSVSIRRLKSAQLFDVATPYGDLPAARLRFEDERGLIRHGVIAVQTPHTRDAILQILSLIR
jgi:hypothetical protein